MSVIEVTCPGCKVSLKVPEDAIGRKGRCRACGTKFIITPPVEQAEKQALATPDDTILAWLGDAFPEGNAKGGASAEITSQSQTQGETKNARPEGGYVPGKTGRDAVACQQTYPMRLDHVDTMGAFFRFRAERLYDKDFRLGFSPKCLICGSRKDLSVHLIVWSSKLVGRQGESQLVQSRLVTGLDKVSGKLGHEFLDKLPPVDNIPEPFCLPFPYYVCPSCSSVGAMVTDVHASPDGQGEECELGISSLRRAEEFARSVCGKDHSPATEIHQARIALKGDPWRQLPLAIRIRIQRWFEPEEGERFVAYFPDADYAKAEAGLAGVVLTNRRLVYHKSIAQTEMLLADRITVNPKDKGPVVQLEIRSGSGQLGRLNALPGNAAELQRLLRAQAAHAH
jgi:hypothetical protein